MAHHWTCNMKHFLGYCLLGVMLLLPSALQAQGLTLGPQLNGGWFNPDTSGQGFFLDISSDSDFLFAGWFTYKPDEPVAGDEPNHRWYTIEGELDGEGDTFPIYLTSDGIFNDPRQTSSQIIGEASFQVINCNSAIFGFALDGGESDSMSITRLLPVDESECDELSASSWQSNTMAELRQGRNSQPAQYQPFLDTASIDAGVYYLAPGAQDNQSAHGEDEVYLVVSGNGQLQVGQQSFAAVPGSVIYVREGIDHRFVSITEELEVVVLFSSANSSPTDPAVLAFDVNTIYAGQPKNTNHWNRFLDVTAMHMGSYSLPLALGGDSPLVHEVDELNYVVRGSATFHIGNESIEVGPGSLVWVEEGNFHHFDQLSEDFQVLIMFHQKPGVPTP